VVLLVKFVICYCNPRAIILEIVNNSSFETKYDAEKGNPKIGIKL
jgi:hypothetical protein